MFRWKFSLKFISYNFENNENFLLSLPELNLISFSFFAMSFLRNNACTFDYFINVINFCYSIFLFLLLITNMSYFKAPWKYFLQIDRLPLLYLRLKFVMFSCIYKHSDLELLLSINVFLKIYKSLINQGQDNLNIFKYI